MSDTTKIQWADATFNPWIGCTKVSPGCKNCYAENTTRAKRSRTSGATWKKPLKWNKTGICVLCGEEADNEHRHGSVIPAIRRRRVFPSLCDWLDPEVPIEDLADFASIVQATPNINWLLLTKRPENFEARMSLAWSYLVSRHGGPTVANWVRDWIDPGFKVPPPGNIWVGTSVENQEYADKRIPALLKIPAKIRFLSAEPLLGPIEFSDVSGRSDAIGQLGKQSLDGIHWVIVGGESGPGARPCNVAWIKSIVQQCKAAGVHCFVKQLGSHVVNTFVDTGEQTDRIWLSHPKGGDPAEWPASTRVREFPQ
jgi:protein gp37